MTTTAATIRPLSTKALASLGYDLSDDADSDDAATVRLINWQIEIGDHDADAIAPLLDAAQEAIDDYAETLDAELDENGYYRRGDMIGGEACDRSEARVRAALAAVRAAL